MRSSVSADIGRASGRRSEVAGGGRRARVRAGASWGNGAAGAFAEGAAGRTLKGMPTSVPPHPRGTVRQGGKEELRASILKTYLLRVRTEKGERAARAAPRRRGHRPSAVDNETGWVSQLAAKRALRAIAELLGRDAHPSPRRMGDAPRGARRSRAHAPRERAPVDAYRYLAQNAREVTRVGTWEIEEPRERTPRRAERARARAR